MGTRKRYSSLVAALVLAGCGELTPAAPATSPSTSAARTPSAPPVIAPTPTSAPASLDPSDPAAATEPAAVPTEAASAAAAAYRTALAAFEAGDVDAYFGGFADPLDCYHGHAARPLADLRSGREATIIANRTAPERTRVHPIELRVLSSTADEVELADFGWTGMGAIDAHTVFHGKRVRLRHVEGVWRIVLEAPLTDRACAPDAPEVAAPYLWTALRDEYRRIVSDCECEHEEDCPGLGGSIGCDPSSWSREPAETCAGASGAELAACLASANDEREAFGFAPGS